ncbi:anti-sigma factor [Roseivivax sediminis]|uniref:Transmembrane transcriptional regulator (Anti-sigma factor RsiW) n=1 Tax=Roseivivax sediminis TaxID=936889 RepID=A0A1I1VEQ2_9RHOB|nr:anti-sigma factor [Roseivivax sediminis]SFD79573.1 Transmembrane transcriptional regulator (anti-sigma factor RsiW) [Roseivivax sediminis]
MTGPTDSSEELEADLPAFLQGRLSTERNYALADYLAERPERAAALMAEARDMEGLRLALSADMPSPSRLVAMARRLQDRLRWRRLLRRGAPVAAAIVLFATGWVGHGVWLASGPEKAPPLVEAALDAHAALELRHWMVSQPEAATFDPQEILAALGIALPPLPADWTVRDVQVVATPDRPGVAMSVDTPDLGPIFVLAVARGGGTAPVSPAAFDYEGRTVAVFERGRSAYVMLDESGHPDQLASGARLLAEAR